MWKKVFVLSLCLCLLFACGCLFASAETIFRDEYISPVNSLSVSNSNSAGAVFKYYGVNTTSGDKNAYIWRSDKAALYSTAYINVPLQSVTSNASISTDISFTIWVPTLKTGATTGSPALSNLDSITFQLSKNTGQVYEYSALTADDATEVIYQETIFTKTYTGYYYKLSRNIPSDVTGFRIYWALSGSGSSASGEQATFGISNIHVYQTADSAADLPLYPENDGSNEVSELENAEQGALDSLGGTQNVDNQMNNALNAIEQLQTLSVGFSLFISFFDRFFLKLPIVYTLITIAVGLGLFGSLLGVVGNYVGRIQSDARADRRASRTVVTRSKTTKDKSGVRTTVSQRRYK